MSLSTNILFVSAVYADDVSCTPAQAVNLKNYIQQNTKKEDQTQNISKLRKMMDYLGDKFEEDFPAAHRWVMKEWEDETKIAAIQRLFMRIENYSKFGKVDFLVERFKKMDPVLVNRAVSFSDSRIKELIKTGNESYQREKNSCKPVDFSAEFGPVEDQGELPWCFAYVVADMIKYKVKKPISQFDIAVANYNGGYPRKIRDWGMVEREITEAGSLPYYAAKKAVDRGVCLQSESPVQDGSEFYRKIKELYALEKTLANSPVNSCQQKLAIWQRYQAMFPSLNESEFFEVLQKANSNNFISRLDFKNCKSRIHPKLTPQHITNITGLAGGAYIRDLDLQIDNRNPVAVGFNGDMLYSLNDVGVTTFDALHTAILTGRRFNEKTGQCEYHMRNSWGRGCQQYDKDLDCRDGQLWIPRVEIKNRGLDAFHF